MRSKLNFPTKQETGLLDLNVVFSKRRLNLCSKFYQKKKIESTGFGDCYEEIQVGEEEIFCLTSSRVYIYQLVITNGRSLSGPKGSSTTPPDP
jgi:hypothetical protein